MEENKSQPKNETRDAKKSLTWLNTVPPFAVSLLLNRLLTTLAPLSPRLIVRRLPLTHIPLPHRTNRFTLEE